MTGERQIEAFLANIEKTRHAGLALLLADLLDERGDERGLRLRRYVEALRRKVETGLEHKRIYDEGGPSGNNSDWYRGVWKGSSEYIEILKERLFEDFISYVWRLMATEPGRRIVRKDQANSLCVRV